MEILKAITIQKYNIAITFSPICLPNIKKKKSLALGKLVKGLEGLKSP